MNNKINFILIGIILISIFFLGFLSNDAYRYYRNIRDYDGLWISGKTHEEAKKIATYYDSIGDWILINVKGMTIEEAIKSCKHETAHEIFAEYCEKSDDNFNKCEELLND